MWRNIKQLLKKRLCLSVLLIPFAHAVAAQPIQIVKIGFSAPLTGPQAHYGKDMENGVELALADFNATQPVIAGKRVKFVMESEDDQADPRVATMVAQKLVDSNIKGMIGHFNSGTTIPASKIYEDVGIPEIAMATAQEYTEQGFKTAFRMMTSDVQQGVVAGRFAVQHLKAKRIAVIDDRTAYGQGLADQFIRSVLASGGKIIDREYAGSQTLYFKAILTRIKSFHPDLIYFGGADSQAAPMVKQMKMLGMHVPLMAGDMVHSPAFLAVAKDAGEGTLTTMPGLSLDAMPGGKAYKARYEAFFNQPVQTYSPYSYDGTMAMLTAMKEANSTEPAVYLPYLAKINMKGVTSNAFSYTKNGDLQKINVTIYENKQGRWVPVDVVR